MLNSVEISRLFRNALENEMIQYNIPSNAIELGIECMAHVYGETDGLKSEISKIVDYTNPAYRCAYLHKYASLHTTMVRDMFIKALRGNYDFFHRLVLSSEQFKLCSLGSGPGTDVIGALAALHDAFGYFDTTATLVDYMVEWKYTFASILTEFGTGLYGAFGSIIREFLHWQYVGANLLDTFRPEVVDALSSASLVTMVKFASAAACTDTHCMIRNIFTAMKPGATLLFIDNDGGGFHKLIVDAANEFHFVSIFGPLHETYSSGFFKKKRFGVARCLETTVSVHVLQKPCIMNPRYNLPYKSETEKGSVILRTKTPSLTSSSSRPLLRIGKSNGKYHRNSVPARQLLLESMPGVPSASESSRPPFIHHSQRSEKNTNRIVYEVKQDLSHDENTCSDQNFISSIEDVTQNSTACNVNIPSHIATPFSSDIVNSPRSSRSSSPILASRIATCSGMLNSSNRHPSHRVVIYNRDTLARCKRWSISKSCFSLKITKFRHRVSRKFTQFKSTCSIRVTKIKRRRRRKIT